MVLFHVIFAFALFAFMVYLIWTMMTAYRRAEGTVFERLLATAQESATILWAKFVMIIGALVGSIGDIGDMLGQPEVRTYAETLLGNPRVVAVLMLAISIISIGARRRTLED